MNIDYNDLQDFMDWTKTKSELKFNPQTLSFPIMPNGIYWAHLGCNIGSEESKLRPVLVTRTYKNSPMCTILPLTTQRLHDGYWYHIDMEHINSTILCEQMRTIDTLRITRPYRVHGKMLFISKKDWELVDKQIKWLYQLKNKPE